jgi:hypothetical protein
MKRFVTHAIGAVTLVGLTASAFAACAHDDSSIFIRGVLAPPTNQTDGTCLYTPDPTQPEISNGELDLGLSQAYYANFIVGNQMNQLANAQQLATETDRVVIQGAIVSITDSATGQQVRASFSTPAAGFVDPGQDGTPSYGVVLGVEIIDPTSTSAYIGQLKAGAIGSATLIADVKLYGTTLGGTHEETNNYEFPVNLVYGVLVSFPNGSSDPAFGNEKACLGASGTSGSSTTAVPPCILGQDQPVDCSLCAGLSNGVCGFTSPPSGGDAGVADASGD